MRSGPLSRGRQCPRAWPAGLLAGALLAATLALALPGGANAGGKWAPEISFAPRPVAPGGTLSITGTGFPARVKVSVRIYIPQPVTIGNPTTDAAGSFKIAINVLRETPSGSTYRVSAEDTEGNRTQAFFKVQSGAAMREGGKESTSSTWARRVGPVMAGMLFAGTAVVLYRAGRSNRSPGEG